MMELEEERKKRLFSLATMKELIGENGFLKAKYDKLAINADEIYGYHWNEVICTVLFNNYVKPNENLMKRYKTLKTQYEMKNNSKESETVKQLNNINEMSTSGGGSTGDGAPTGNNSGAYETPTAWSKGNKSRRFFNNTLIKGSKVIPKGTPDNSINMNVNESFDLDSLFEQFSSQLNELDLGLDKPSETPSSTENKAKVYTYHIVTDNNNDFYADIRDEESNTVFEIKTLDEVNNLLNNGTLKSKEDLEGLTAYLKQNAVLQNDDVLQMAEVNESFFAKAPQNLGLKINEEVKPNGMIQAERIKNVNQENSLAYYKTLNTGIQDMINAPKEHNQPIEATIKYEFDNNGVEVVNGVFPEEGKYNDEYKETAHRGMEDLKLDREDETYDKRLKGMIGDKAYNIVKEKQKIIQNKDLRNLQKGKTEVVDSTIKESFISGFYRDNFDKKYIKTTKLGEIKETNILNEDVKFFETKGVGNVFNEILKEEIDNFNFYYSLNENSFFKIKKENDLKNPKNLLSESVVNKVKHLSGYDPSKNMRNLVDRSKL